MFFGSKQKPCNTTNVLQEDHNFKQALRIRNPKHRLKKILDACKNKAKCEGGDEIEVRNLDSEEPINKSPGGCGAQQPKITIQGMNMIAEYKAQTKKNFEREQLAEPVERKQILSAKRVSNSGCKLLLARLLFFLLLHCEQHQNDTCMSFRF